ncbi:MAP7 domain-containing protein 2-like isoform X9 [Sipha flava]|uniref:MAP7 domain-containing protein 2-like isoform X9 n=1 Tax=Sipha flava TaxID=143950 RepID=A0A8B8FKS7_9HEMI|nr:MAP7 domain-containing protein 2-like isoform X9 [Sipha flava]
MAGLLRVPHYRHNNEDSRRTGPEEGIDNLLLVPESVLDMDGNQLRDDLNGLRFAFRKQYLQADLGPQGNIWISGVTTVNSDNRPSTAPTPPQNPSKGGLHWFAHGADSFDFYGETYETGKDAIKDREERLRLVREKHDEERQRKLEELKQQALAVQRYREQKEEERRRRLEEMRSRDFERRQQVEERKRQLFEAEREKREAILKKNQEREARIESKRRNERSSIVFAFGSSTPRMLEPSETGGSYWASRRATSTSNVMMLSSTTPMGPLTRRSSERELNECSGKKRAASAGGLSNRNTDDFSEYNKRQSVTDVLRWSDVYYPVIPEYPVDMGSEGGDGSAERKAARRKTDLMPTILSPRDLTPCSRPGSASSSRRSPGRASSMTRLDRAAATCGGSGAAGAGGGHLLSSARSMSHLAVGGGGRSALSVKDRSAHHRSMIALNPVPPPRLTRAERLRKRAREFANGGGAGMKSGEMTPSRPQSSMSQSSTGPLPSQPRSRPVATPRKPRPISIAVTGITASTDQSAKSPATGERPPLPKVNVTKKTITPKTESKKFPNDNKQSTTKEKIKNTKSSETSENVESSQHHSTAVMSKDEDSQENSIQESISDLAECDMTASMLATKQKISTEEEAKAALAERRRLAREQAEKDAELERQRLEAERLAEEERLRCEEEEQRRQEEEQLRLLEEARKSEELRLQLAIEETKKREEEEKKRKEEELKLKLEKEEADRKAKEEAEKLRQEMEIKLKKEEEDRQLRRKRVEAIMLRTRNQGKGSSNASTKEETESTEQQAGEKTEKLSSDLMTTSQGPVSDTEAMLTAERNHSSSSVLPPDDVLSNGLLLEPSGPKQNGHTNNDDNSNNSGAIHHSNGHSAANGSIFGSEVQLNNVTNNLLDLSLEPIPSDTLSTQQIIDIGMSKCIQDNATDFTAYQETNRSEKQIVNDLLS